MKYLIPIFIIISVISCSNHDKDCLMDSFLNSYNNCEKNLHFSEIKLKGYVNYTDQEESINEKAKECIDFINKIRDDLFLLDCENCKSIEKLNQPLGNEISTNYFFAGDHKNWTSFKLKMKLEEYRQFIFLQINNDSITNLINDRLSTYDPPPKNGIQISWGSEKFECVPLISCFITLMQLEYEIREVQLLTIRYLRENDINAS